MLNMLNPLGISPEDLAIEQIEILKHCTRTHKEEIERRAGVGAVAMYSGVSTLLHKPVGPVSGIILFLFENLSVDYYWLNRIPLRKRLAT